MSFAFDRATHTYTLEGAVLPGVTSVLKAQRLITSPPVADPFYLERGKAAHEAIRLWLEGDLDESTVDEQVRPYLQSAQAFCELVGFEPIAAEIPLHCSITRTAGTPDAIGFSRAGILLPDWKCGPHQPGYAVQVGGAYLSMLRQPRVLDALGLSTRDAAGIKPCVVPLSAALPRPVWIDPQEASRLTTVYRAAVTCYAYRRAEGMAE